MTVKEAIETRRSVRRFKPDAVPQEILNELIDSARLAPSGCNAQPWRFKIVTDRATKVKLAHAAHRQPFIARAPVVLVCCAEIQPYIDSTVNTMQDLGRMGAIDKDSVQILCDNAEGMNKMDISEIGPIVAFNVAIAVEHIVLRAVELGLGTCWVKLIDEIAIKEIFGWDDSLHVACLLPLGYAAIAPKPREKHSREDLLL